MYIEVSDPSEELGFVNSDRFDVKLSYLVAAPVGGVTVAEGMRKGEDAMSSSNEYVNTLPCESDLLCLLD